MSFGRVLACSLVVIWMLADSATAGQRILDLQARPADNPTTGPEFSILEVEDKRAISEIETEQTRTIGIDRRRNPILLPEGRSLESLVREMVTKAFRAEGVRTLEVTRSGGEAHEVRVKVIRFWGSGRSRALVVFYSFDGELEIQSDLPGWEAGIRVPVAFTRGSWGANVSGRWQSSQQEGVDRLVEGLRVKLREALGDGVNGDAGASWSTQERQPSPDRPLDPNAQGKTDDE